MQDRLLKKKTPSSASLWLLKQLLQLYSLHVHSIELAYVKIHAQKKSSCSMLKRLLVQYWPCIGFIQGGQPLQTTVPTRTSNLLESYKYSKSCLEDSCFVHGTNTQRHNWSTRGRKRCCKDDRWLRCVSFQRSFFIQT